MPKTYSVGDQKITTYYEPVTALGKRAGKFNAMQERMDQRPDSWGNV
jgi:hypothetical protein